MLNWWPLDPLWAPRLHRGLLFIYCQPQELDGGPHDCCGCEFISASWGGGLGLAYSAKITHPSRNCTKNRAVRGEKILVYHYALQHKHTKMRRKNLSCHKSISHIEIKRIATELKPNKKQNKFKLFFLVDIQRAEYKGKVAYHLGNKVTSEIQNHKPPSDRSRQHQRPQWVFEIFA